MTKPASSEPKLNIEFVRVGHPESAMSAGAPVRLPGVPSLSRTLALGTSSRSNRVLRLIYDACCSAASYSASSTATGADCDSLVGDLPRGRLDLLARGDLLVEVLLKEVADLGGAARVRVVDENLVHCDLVAFRF